MLEEDGWFLARTRGSHRQYKHASKPAWLPCQEKPGTTWHQVRSTASLSRRA